jgi:hypothetical protein
MNPILVEQILQLLLGFFLTAKGNDAANAPFIAAIKAALAANEPVPQATMDALLAADDAADAALQGA